MQLKATYGLVGMSVIVFIATAIQSGSFFDNLSFSPLGDAWTLYGPQMYTPTGLLRAIGWSFVHIGPTHLALNMVLLSLVGQAIERDLGSGLTLLAYLTGAVGSAAFSLALQPMDAAAGASGAIFALLGVLIGRAVRYRQDIQSAVTLLGANLVFTALMPGVAVWGHIGGALTGLALAFTTYGFRRVSTRAWATGALFVGAWVALWLVLHT